MTLPAIDSRAVRRRFGRVAATYGEGGFLAREIDVRMQARLDYVRLPPGTVVDLGCSRGDSLPGLAGRFPGAPVVGVDAALPMLLAGQPTVPAWKRWLGGAPRDHARRLAADAARLPLKAASTTLVWSNLLLHWLGDPRPVIAETHRILADGGLFMFSTLGPDSLKELRAAFADGQPHTQPFIDMHDLGDMLVAQGFADPVMDMETVTLTYDRLDTLLAELRAAGSCCAVATRQRGLTGRRAWAAMCARYETLRVAGKLPATFEVVYGHAWKVAARTTADGRAIVRFAPRGGGGGA